MDRQRCVLFLIYCRENYANIYATMIFRIYSFSKRFIRQCLIFSEFSISYTYALFFFWYNLAEYMKHLATYWSFSVAAFDTWKCPMDKTKYSWLAKISFKLSRSLKSGSMNLLRRKQSLVGGFLILNGAVWMPMMLNTIVVKMSWLHQKTSKKILKVVLDNRKVKISKDSAQKVLHKHLGMASFKSPHIRAKTTTWWWFRK